MKSTALIPLTLAEYIAHEESSQTRHEYIGGQLIPMPGTSDVHNEICFQLNTVFRQALKETTCRVFQENVKVEVSPEKDYTYPDVFVTCDPRDREDPYIKRHPVVIVEVISPSSRVNDRTDKFLRYIQIPSLQHYVLADYEKKLIEVWYRTEDANWDYTPYTDLSSQAYIPALDISIPLSVMG
ncbi:MAG: Uma2 family endonuclease [Bacteroidia bacterium]|nr:Uma2 family endonuclease [Bacteroidia bacterium]